MRSLTRQGETTNTAQAKPGHTNSVAGRVPAAWCRRHNDAGRAEGIVARLASGRLA
jgi:hypothetical protein